MLVKFECICTFGRQKKYWIALSNPCTFGRQKNVESTVSSPCTFGCQRKCWIALSSPCTLGRQKKCWIELSSPCTFGRLKKCWIALSSPCSFGCQRKCRIALFSPCTFGCQRKCWIALSSPCIFCRQKNVESRAPALSLSAVRKMLSRALQPLYFLPSEKMLSRVFQPFLPPLPPLLSYPPYSRLYRQHKVTQFVHKINLKMNLSFLIAKQVSGTEDQMERIERSLNFVSDGKSISLVRYVCKIYLDSECWHRVISPQRVSSSILKMCISKLTRAETPRTVLLAILNHFSVN